jgi:cation transport regulator ChaC
MIYFAYGSNMLEEWIRNEDRAPGAIFMGLGQIFGYKLRFHKRSNDGSGKCNIIRSDLKTDLVYGIVYEFPQEQLCSLNQAEGLNYGYHQECKIPVRMQDGCEKYMLIYIADNIAIDDELKPYDWYYQLVICGAKEHRLPDEYISYLETITTTEDPIKDRKNKIKAELALEKYKNKK